MEKKVESIAASEGYSISIYISKESHRDCF